MQFIYVRREVLKIVVFPELSSPIIIIFSYFLPFSFENIFVNIEPINLKFLYLYMPVCLNIKDGY